MAKYSVRRLARFLQRYSAKCSTVKNMFNQWRLIEVRDVGRRRDLVCPCGRTGLRYVCFIRNRLTNVQTYVGEVCIKNFSGPFLPRVLTVLESLAINGVTAQYMGSGGHGSHRFALRPKSMLIKRFTLLKHFFSRLPYAQTQCGWMLSAFIRHNQYTFLTPRLRRGKWYKLTLGAVTKSKKTRPELLFYADRIRPSHL